MERSEIIGEFRRISSMPYGQARIVAAENLVNTVAESEHEEFIAASLLDLVEAYTFAEDGVNALATYARVLRTYDSRPELFDEVDRRNMYWEYKWVVNDAMDYPVISAEQVDALIDDMERRYQLAGIGLGPVKMARLSWAGHRGADDVEARMEEWLSWPSSDGDDCKACEVGQQAAYYLGSKKFEDAVRIALTQRGECNQEPWGTRNTLALAALRSGQDALAIRAYKEALAAKTDEPHSNLGDARQIEFLARAGHIDRAVRLINEWERHRSGDSPLATLQFLLHTIMGLSVAADPHYEQMRADYIDEARALAEAFDRRNGTSKYCDALDECINAPAGVRVLDLDAQARALIEASRSGEQMPQIEQSLFVEDTNSSGDPSPEGSGEAPSPEATAGTLTEAEAWQRAEDALAVKDYLRAAYYYQRASSSAEEAGYLDKAGIALAEAAQSLNAAGEGMCSELFGRAVSLLRAGDASSELIAHVLDAWAPIAYEHGVIGIVASHQADILSDLDGMAEIPAALARVRTGLRDSLARSLDAQAEDLPRAYELAFQAGEEFGKQGSSMTNAAESFWLAGRLAAQLGHTEDAIFALDSAFEGFTLARRLDERTKCGEELLDLLRSTGQTEKAEELLKVL
ncbi:hypothetical protein I6E29_08320 [Arcanobacterium haemolyticum]|nr:hypothetical protein [Arcanobacterium haemolyticum]